MPHRHHSGPMPPSAQKHTVRRRRRPVRRIPLKSFEALSRAKVELGNRLLALLPAPVPDERLLDGLADEMARLVGTEHDIFFHTMRTYAGCEFTERLDELFVTTLRLSPDPDEAVFAADRTLVGSWLEELLEDEPPEARTLAPPSPRDFGLVTFVLMQLVNWLCGRGLPPLSLPSAAPNPKAVVQRLRCQTEIAEIVYAVTSPRAAGLARIFLPADLVRSMEVFASVASRRQRSRKRLQMTRLGNLRVRLMAALGAVRLTRHELQELEGGDILLPSAHGLREDALDEEPIEGAGRLGLDARSSSYLPCTLTRHKDFAWQLELTGAIPITPETLARGDKMSTKQAAKSPTSTDHPADLLEQAEVVVEIRVGSLSLPVSTLAELQSGYVLELERSVDDGVELVVNGRTIGRGELVNVEGRLGVRVMSLRE